MYKVFIVDDEPLILEGLHHIINWEAQELEIIGTAINGNDALEKMKTLKVDIILTDIRMPETDGLELIRKTKETNPCIKYIIMSGYDDFEYLKECIKLGIENYLLKPINQEELLSTLVNTVDKIENDLFKKSYLNNDTSSLELIRNMKPIVKRVIEYIHCNYQIEISIKLLASKTNTNANYLGQLFREETGESFSNYLNLYRINKAKDLLLNTKFKSSEISSLVGFSDPTYFYKMFRKYIGCSPNKFKSYHAFSVK
jgi:two-component system, response regulator YesN